MCESTIANFVLGNTTDIMAINVFHKHRQLLLGTTYS